MGTLKQIFGIEKSKEKSETQKNIEGRQREVENVFVAKLSAEGQRKIEQGRRRNDKKLKREGEQLVRKAAAVQSGEITLLKAIGAIREEGS